MSTANRSAPARQQVFAPGLRVEIRDAEWIIKSADLTSAGDHSLLVTGISELVRGKEARFITEIDRVKPLYPEDTELIPDRSPRFAATIRPTCVSLCMTPPLRLWRPMAHSGRHAFSAAASR